MKNSVKRAAAALLAAAALCGAVFVHSLGVRPALPEGTGQSYLYGEIHFSEAVHATEFELWSEYYHQRGMRHLFLELPYSNAQWLNLWMQADSDELLDEYIQELVETRQDANSPLPAGAYEMEREFYKRIKEDCPETVFHGTDVGHMYWSFGERYLKLLEDAGQTDTEQYRLAEENIAQGEYFYGNAPGGDHTYREEKMAENFIRERDKLGNADIMGIYGAAHVGQDGMTTWGKEFVPNMAGQLTERYGEDVHCEDVTDSVQPLGTDTINLAGKDYTAQYFGKCYSPTPSGDYYMEYWRLEDAYEDFRYAQLTNKFLYVDQYFPMAVEAGQIFVVDRAAKGTVERSYYRCTGATGSSKGDLRTDGFLVE